MTTPDRFVKKKFRLMLKVARKTGLLTQGAEHVGFALSTFANDVGVCWPSHAKIAHEVAICERQVRRCLDQLAALDFCSWAASPLMESKRGSNTYQLASPTLPAVTTKSEGRAVRSGLLAAAERTGRLATTVASHCRFAYSTAQHNKELESLSCEGSADIFSGPGVVSGAELSTGCKHGNPHTYPQEAPLPAISAQHPSPLEDALAKFGHTVAEHYGHPVGATIAAARFPRVRG